MIKRLFSIGICLSMAFCLPTLVHAQGWAYPPSFPDAIEETYKQIGEVDMKLWIFNPNNLQQGDQRPAIVFFFGGGWRGGSPAQFYQHCKYLSARDMVAIVADYRVSSRHQVKGNACVADAKSAVRWIRSHASRLGIDPSRIVASGGSAGGHLAASTATLSDHDEAGEDFSISSQPNALALFNPVAIVAPVAALGAKVNGRLGNLAERMGVELESISPYHHVRKGLPPTIIFHGTGDKTVPYPTVNLFAQKMKEKGNRCELVGYEGEAHGFFNYGRNGNGAFIDTVNKLDAFLVSLGYLPAPPKVVGNSQ